MKSPTHNNESPYRRFTIILATCVIIFGALLSIAVIFLIQNFVIRETVDLTRQAVIKHFAVLPQLKSLYTEDNQPAESGESDASGYGESKSGYGYGEAKDSDYTDGGTDSRSPDDYGTLKAIVQMHFDLYDVLETNFYYTDGYTLFSYDENLVGRMAGNARMDYIRDAVDGEAISQRLDGHLIELWIPIRNEGGTTTGVVQMVRDITDEDRQIQRVLIGLIALIVAGMVVLFFSLRQIFIKSTQTIDAKNKELAELVQLIRRTYDESLQALSSALDSRDNETQGHSFRVTAYAIRLGKAMGLNAKDLGLLARGALLHDVGKIGVPDRILLKPGKLTEEEWEIMRNHVTIGYDMLKHIDFLQPSLEVVQYHHERWDGKGYLHKLAGENIPLFARIFALCDTYDAITSDRPYRAGRSYRDAKEEIQRCAGSQFDPEVVQAFLDIDPADWSEIAHQSRSGSSAALLDEMLLEVDPMSKAV